MYHLIKILKVTNNLAFPYTIVMGGGLQRVGPSTYDAGELWALNGKSTGGRARIFQSVCLQKRTQIVVVRRGNRHEGECTIVSSY
jgi:hypothetical protein